MLKFYLFLCWINSRPSSRFLRQGLSVLRHALSLLYLILILSKSYSTKLEEIVPLEEQSADGNAKNSLELLIERIQKIQLELAQEPINEEESAFTEAAEEHLHSLSVKRHHHLSGGKQL